MPINLMLMNVNVMLGVIKYSNIKWTSSRCVLMRTTDDEEQVSVMDVVCHTDPVVTVQWQIHALQP